MKSSFVEKGFFGPQDPVELIGPDAGSELFLRTKRVGSSKARMELHEA